MIFVIFLICIDLQLTVYSVCDRLTAHISYLISINVEMMTKVKKRIKFEQTDIIL